MNAITNWFDKVLVPEWRSFWKMLSFWWTASCTTAAPMWLALTDEQRAAILSALGVSPAWYVAGAFVVGFLLRMKSQGLKE